VEHDGKRAHPLLALLIDDAHVYALLAEPQRSDEPDRSCTDYQDLSASLEKRAG
jgi:hypothetical protein